MRSSGFTRLSSGKSVNAASRRSRSHTTRPSTRSGRGMRPSDTISSNFVAPTRGEIGGYLVQVSSQRSELDAEASYRALQDKFPGVLGSRSPLIKRADLGDKGVYYRAMVGPFGSLDEASQFCGSLKTAGGQCVVQRN